ncbi:MAG: hypothetical protein SH856_03315 [Flavobacteriales bacterium]|nr:hypothetical protein [Flavobacteriales bacterium]
MPDAIVVAWFENTAQEYEQFFAESEKQLDVKLVKEIRTPQVESKRLILLEHYPLLSIEEEMLRNWKAKEIVVLNSLEEPLLVQFGNENIIPLMKKTGMNEDEYLEHKMISSSIGHAQRKLDSKVKNEFKANSQKEWFAMNFLN